MNQLTKIISNINNGVEKHARTYAHLIWGEVIAFFVAIFSVLVFLRWFNLSFTATALIAIGICAIIAIGIEFFQKKTLNGKNTTREFLSDALTTWAPCLAVIPLVMNLMETYL